MRLRWNQELSALKSIFEIFHTKIGFITRTIVDRRRITGQTWIYLSLSVLRNNIFEHHIVEYIHCGQFYKQVILNFEMTSCNEHVSFPY